MISSRTFRLLPASISLTGALVLGALVPAHASSTTKTDPAGDVFLAESGGGIDLAAVRLATGERKKRVRVTFRLHEPVVSSSLVRPGGLSVHFVTGRRTSRVVTISTVDGELRGAICSDSADDARGLRDCRRLPVTEVDGTAYRVAVGLARIKKGATVLRWSASSLDIRGGQPVSDWLRTEDRKPFRWRL